MEETEKTNEKKPNFEKIIGIILLIPPILSVILFLLNLFVKNIGDIPEMSNLSSEWTGSYGYDTGGGGYSSSIPFYFGLMAIAGAYLIKGTSKNK
ncbi:hypothetical protein [uncultured Maribacter sp.]|uniref:hypothetical protein n=1 Tax=uncultured Maribacter sp. TaxID=431308 RepID=UPI00260B0DE3|nr:hypothetical protein [uncultured Maribacter sp.]